MRYAWMNCRFDLLLDEEDANAIRTGIYNGYYAEDAEYRLEDDRI
jgi:hypothetical protein